MSAPLHIQDSGLVTAVSASTDIVLTGVTAGSTLAVIILKASAGERTWTVSDDLNGTWDLAASTGISGRGTHVYYKTGVAVVTLR